MSDPINPGDGARDGADMLLAKAVAADAAARRGLDHAIADLFLTDTMRLDEGSRVALVRLVQALVDTVEAEVKGHAVRLLHAQAEPALAQAVDVGGAFFRLRGAGLLHDADLMAELIARVRERRLADAIPMLGPDEPDRPSLINRLTEHPDRLLAQGAMAVLVAESRRRSVPEKGLLTQTDLPAELHHKLVWWVAAASRERSLAAATTQRSRTVLDRALADAAQRSLAAHDEGNRLESAVMRLVSAIGAQGAELAELMIEALGDRRVTLFSGLLAHALGVEYAIARGLVLDAPDGRLWVALRALRLERTAIARIGVALSEADPRGDLENFADTLDATMAITLPAARDALAGLRLPSDFRAAMLALEPRA